MNELKIAQQKCSHYIGNRNGVSDYCILEPGETMQCIYASREQDECPWFEDAVRAEVE